jgi:hypothetical protein
MVMTGSFERRKPAAFTAESWILESNHSAPQRYQRGAVGELKVSGCLLPAPSLRTFALIGYPQ